MRLKKELSYTTTEVTRNLYRLEKETNAIRDLFEHKEVNYYKLERMSNYWSNNYIEYKSNGDTRKIISVNNS